MHEFDPAVLDTPRQLFKRVPSSLVDFASPQPPTFDNDSFAMPCLDRWDLAFCGLYRSTFSSDSVLRASRFNNTQISRPFIIWHAPYVLTTLDTTRTLWRARNAGVVRHAEAGGEFYLTITY